MQYLKWDLHTYVKHRLYYQPTQSSKKIRISLPLGALRSNKRAVTENIHEEREGIDKGRETKIRNEKDEKRINTEISNDRKRQRKTKREMEG